VLLTGNHLYFHLSTKIARYLYSYKNKDSYRQPLWICIMQPAFLLNSCCL